MGKKSNNYFFAALTILVIALCVTFYNFIGQKAEQEKNEYTHTITLGTTAFDVEVVRTDAARAQGLSGREELCEKCGMLFIFDQPGQHSFWMKDMRFDIDIVWLHEGEIVHIEEKISHKTPQKKYKPPVDADAVLELDAGSVRKYDIILESHIQ